MTEENLSKDFRFTFRSLSRYFLWTAGNLFHVAWQGNFETWVTNPLKKNQSHMRGIHTLVNQQ
jgi:photosystem I P700 chlorophyll a apoprotein A2